MKQLKCEMCGSVDLIKQNGVFVCQSCGCKYSVEEAKKMMVEGTVDVSGSVVKVDTTDELANLYQIARRAKDDNNGEKAAKYYDMILVKDPASWEASFFSVYFTSMSCKIADISLASNNISNCIESSFRLINKNYTSTDRKIECIKEILQRCDSWRDFASNAALSWISGLDPLIKSKFQMQAFGYIVSAGNVRIMARKQLCEVFGEDEKIMSEYGVDMLKGLFDDGLATDADGARLYIETIQKYEPSYQPPSKQTVSDVVKSIDVPARSGGCYVATCVYGSYDCPQVWTLRRYRDYTLAETWYGRAFIHTYYALSPTLVKWFGNTKWFKKVFKGKLDKVVSELQAKGVEATPYKDIRW